MQKYNWNYPTTMWVGENRINDIALACKNLNILKPLFVLAFVQSNTIWNEMTSYENN